jgi:hypothetical protein
MFLEDRDVENLRYNFESKPYEVKELPPPSKSSLTASQCGLDDADG